MRSERPRPATFRLRGFTICSHVAAQMFLGCLKVRADPPQSDGEPGRDCKSGTLSRGGAGECHIPRHRACNHRRRDQARLRENESATQRAPSQASLRDPDRRHPALDCRAGRRLFAAAESVLLGLASGSEGRESVVPDLLQIATLASVDRRGASNQVTAGAGTEHTQSLQLPLRDVRHMEDDGIARGLLGLISNGNWTRFDTWVFDGWYSPGANRYSLASRPARCDPSQREHSHHAAYDRASSEETCSDGRVNFNDVIISLDGPPEVHDRIRRVKTHSGAYRRELPRSVQRIHLSRSACA